VLGLDIASWIQIITDCLAGPTVCPETSSNPGAEEEHHPGIVRRAEFAVDGQASMSR
jgi:hypothetical protein